MTPVAELKLVHRATWAAGDYAAVARHIDEGPAPRPARADGQSTPATRSSTSPPHRQPRPSAPPPPARPVVGLDLTPELFETARARAAAHDVVVDWVEGDAEELPLRGRRL